jgi:type III pantothenate kinase
MNKDSMKHDFFLAELPRLVIDFGNTLAKIAVFEKGKIVELATSESINTSQLATLKEKFQINHCIVSSVTTIAPEIKDFLKHKFNLTELNHLTKVPIKNLYKTPETLGKDRLAAVVGAFILFPATHCLVIDAGTCITSDFLDNQGNYHGGAISPGINMRFKSLHTFTSRLPLITSKDLAGFTGKTTEESILAGVLHGTLAELNCTIQKYQEIYPGIQIVLTGGDMNFFEGKLKSNIFAAPNLVLTGLNEILDFNAVN